MPVGSEHSQTSRSHPRAHAAKRLGRSGVARVDDPPPVRAPWNMPRSRACAERDGTTGAVRPGARTRPPAPISRIVSGNPGAVTHSPYAAASRANRSAVPTGPMMSTGARSRRQEAVLPGEDQRRQVAVMVDVKMRDRDVRDRLPRGAELGEPARDAASRSRRGAGRRGVSSR